MNGCEGIITGENDYAGTRFIHIKATNDGPYIPGPSGDKKVRA